MSRRSGKRSLAEYDAIIKLDPKNWGGYNVRGLVRQALNEHEAAIKDFTEAIRVTPLQAAPHRNRAIAYRDLKQFDKSLADWNAALAINGTDAWTYDQRGHVYILNGDVDKAITDLDRAIELNPNFVQAYRNRAWAHDKKGEKVKERQDRVIIAALEQGLTRAEIDEGFESIFDGKSLKGWYGSDSGYLVENGVLVCLKFTPEGKPFTGNLYTQKEYGDFVFRFEYKLEPGANNGIFVRGQEIQILDDYAPQYANLAAAQYNGSIYGKAAAKRGHAKAASEWNTEEITVKGTHWKVVLNGVTILEQDISKVMGLESVTSTPRPLGFLGHNSRVEFRHLRVKSLK